MQAELATLLKMTLFHRCFSRFLNCKVYQIAQSITDILLFIWITNIISCQGQNFCHMWLEMFFGVLQIFKGQAGIGRKETEVNNKNILLWNTFFMEQYYIFTMLLSPLWLFGFRVSEMAGIVNLASQCIFQKNWVYLVLLALHNLWRTSATEEEWRTCFEYLRILEDQEIS